MPAENSNITVLTPEGKKKLEEELGNSSWFGVYWSLYLKHCCCAILICIIIALEMIEVEF